MFWNSICYIANVIVPVRYVMFSCCCWAVVCAAVRSYRISATLSLYITLAGAFAAVIVTVRIACTRVRSHS